MKYITIFFLIASFYSEGQLNYGKIEISAFKEVVIKTPDKFPIKKAVPGMDERYIKFEIIPPNLLSIKAQEGTDFPPTNLTIYCNGAIFQTDIILNHSTESYYHNLTESHGIIIDTGDISPEKSENEQATPVQQSNMLDYHPDYNAPKGPVEPSYFNVDRQVKGVDFQGMLIYINNIISTKDFIYISFRINNETKIPFYTDFVKLYIKTNEKKKKFVASLDSGSEPLFSSLVNNPNMNILPGNSELYIYEFKKFSLGKNDYLTLVLEEGNGKRSVNVNLKAKKFQKMIEFKF